MDPKITVLLAFAIVFVLYLFLKIHRAVIEGKKRRERELLDVRTYLRRRGLM
jgi:hypothetical protein